MLRVVLDANVVISAAISQQGNPACIFEKLIQGEIVNYTTQEIVDEIKEVLQRPRIAKKLSSGQQEFILRAFEELSQKIEPSVKFAVVIDDPDDDKFIDCAFSASAQYIISGDEHLLNLKEFRGVFIVSPAEFVVIINQKVG